MWQDSSSEHASRRFHWTQRSPASSVQISSLHPTRNDRTSEAAQCEPLMPWLRSVFAESDPGCARGIKNMGGCVVERGRRLAQCSLTLRLTEGLGPQSLHNGRIPVFWAPAPATFFHPSHSHSFSPVLQIVLLRSFSASLASIRTMRIAELAYPSFTLVMTQLNSYPLRLPAYRSTHGRYHPYSRVRRHLDHVDPLMVSATSDGLL